MNIPTVPMAGLLTFWGGVQNGFWAFGHSPATYSENITCPTLLMYGAQDERVSRKETDQIFENLGGKKELKIYQLAGHENYLLQYEDKWREDVKSFLAVESHH